MSIQDNSTDPLHVGETVSSSSEKVTIGPAKAIAAAVGGALVGGLTALQASLSDEVVTSQEWTTIALATIIGSGLVAGATFFTPASVTRQR